LFFVHFNVLLWKSSFQSLLLDIDISQGNVATHEVIWDF